MDGFEVVEPETLAAAEVDEAKVYWSKLGFHAGYSGPRHWSEHMADQVLRLRPRSVLEFGCNAGRNLAAIRQRSTTVRLVGIDVNEEAVQYGRDKGLDLRVGDETMLRDMPAAAVDVIFTVSVIDHVPRPEDVLGPMLRAARIGVILLEPWIGREGKIVRNPVPGEEGVADTTPYSYSWDYERLVGKLSPAMKLDVTPYPLSGTNLGPYYQIFRVLHPRSRRLRYRFLRRSP